MDVYTPVALKLHAFGLQHLHDPNWTGTVLYDELKRPFRQDDMLQVFRKDGFLFWLGNLLFGEYLSNGRHAEDLRGEYLVWYLEDFCELLRHHNANNGAKSLTRLEGWVTKIGGLYEKDEEKYWRLVDSRRTGGKLYDLFFKLLSKNKALIDEITKTYSANYADRVFHDRELCAYLSQLLVSIGFDGMWSPKDTEPKQWANRVNIPVWAKELVEARDRGHCAKCRTAITLELEADDQFDHMVPLSRGGCNDIVNLQLLCEKCNLKKSNKDVPIQSSIPPYMLRFQRKK